MQNFILFTANVRGEKGNCLYPNKIEVTDEKVFERAMQYDHVCGTFKNNYRSNENFLESNVIPMDCDNDHSDNPQEWVYPVDVAKNFPDCNFYVNYSRSHLKPKGNKSARPRFHIYFPIPTITSGSEYAELKKKIQELFPYFDDGALGEARFFFGTQEPMVEIYEGTKNVLDFINVQCALETDAFSEFDAKSDEISEGSRNTTMSRIAARLIKRYGNTDEALHKFLEESTRCNPRLDLEELNQIWNSAIKFGQKLSQDPSYIPPEIYNSSSSLEPADFTDAGQALVLANEYGDKLKYSPATNFIHFNGRYWEESEPLAEGISVELTDRQLKEVENRITMLLDEMERNGALQILATHTVKTAKKRFNSEQYKVYSLFEHAKEFKKFILKTRDVKGFLATLRAARHKVLIDAKELDKNEFLLNCPNGTLDLRQGIASMRDNAPEDFITKETLVNPSNEGAAIWQDALELFFQNDKALIDYVQRIVGLASIGKVYVEALIIAYGEGRNGKSTFWNAISRVLGTYSGNISADMLIAGCRRNVKPELAEAKGKRILIASELEEGRRLNTAMVKQLCSTDEIYAEKKYKDPFAYIPTHTLVLYTNHLPKVGAIDKGTWRRLIVIPFKAKIEGKSDIKNYADYLVENAGGAILSWIIEGAQKVIESHFDIKEPDVVKEAIGKYREMNDWLDAFLQDQCEVDKKNEEKSGEFYNRYRAYCAQMGEYIRCTQDFYSALTNAGFERYRNKHGSFIKGVRLKSEFDE